MTRRSTFVPADVDPAGTLGTTEADMESVWPDWAPDMHGYIERARLFARIVGLILYGAFLLGIGVFVGWVWWGQS